MDKYANYFVWQVPSFGVEHNVNIPLASAEYLTRYLADTEKLYLMSRIMFAGPVF